MTTLACGPYIGFDTPGLWASVIVFVVFKPVAYFAFVKAFRFRVSRPIPMTTRHVVKLTLAGAGLGILFFGIGAAVFMAYRSETVLMWSWVYLYGTRVLAWFIVGRVGAGLRGRRLIGWIISGTLINVAFDFAFVGGVFSGWIFPAGVLAGIFAFIAVLGAIGRRDSLKARFSGSPCCVRCQYSLLGNLSGQCPECGTAVA